MLKKNFFIRIFLIFEQKKLNFMVDKKLLHPIPLKQKKANIHDL